MAKISTKRVEFIERHELAIDGVTIDGAITNRSSDGKFIYRTEDYGYEITAEQLRAIADKLDELNVRERLIESA